MGAPERERTLYRPLQRAGLQVVPHAVPDGTVPFVLGWRPEDVGGGFSHPHGTPRLVERLNEDRYELAASSGLLDRRREFLVLLPQGAHAHRVFLREMHQGGRATRTSWTRVRLLELWDVKVRGAASAFLGIRAGRPGFGMMALDGSVYLCCSTGERGVDVVAVPHPHRSANVLRQLEWFASRKDGRSPAERELRERIAL
ncbi:hypothetical protein [Streptomyces sp. C10-9-1]|uniref:hypothetical protein n=1 Tax=Streptomyces sp. C10-9-1 TaxID=1859285 RepID=UPI003D74D34E